MCNGLIIKRKSNSARQIVILFLFLMFLVVTLTLSGQPSMNITITEEKGLNFGEFYPTSGGQITINSQGARSVAVGGVVLLPSAYHQCVLNVNVDTQANNRPINITVDNSIRLNKIDGSFMILDLFASPFNYRSDKDNPNTKINIGGTLHVGNIMLNPSGNYNGTFTITVNGQ